ncbi:MAG: hypothetical protein AAFR17_05100 [Pseudomonadota bacterium]
MTKEIDTPEALSEDSLDAAAGGYRYQMKNVLVTSYQTGSSASSGDHDKWIDVLSIDHGTHTPGGAGNAVPSEDFSLNFEEIKVT